MLGTHITKKHFLAMWVIQDLEWREFLAYTSFVVTSNITNHDASNFTLSNNNILLECNYQVYYHRHQIAISSILTFTMICMETIFDHVT
jgi:hypothetical protein